GNIFLAGDPSLAYGPTRRPGQVIGTGTGGYNGHPSSLAEYQQKTGDPTLGDHERFAGVKQPVYIHDNVYAGATPFEGELTATILEASTVSFEVIDTGDEVYLNTRLPEAFAEAQVPPVGGRDLPPVRFVGAEYEERDGTPVKIDIDLVGSTTTKTHTNPAGPITHLTPGERRIRIW
ncbi:MAG: hypothetical protein WAL91_12145, partial [Propionicimonas sp.]